MILKQTDSTIKSKYPESASNQEVCYHCGERCNRSKIVFDEKLFCCDGCKLVYDLLKGNNLCTYYKLNTGPGISQGKLNYTGKFDHLDLEQVQEKLVTFHDDHQTQIVFYIPGIHCSSCIWLLENLHRLNKGIFSCQVNFIRKEVNIRFDHHRVKLSELAELLNDIGYEPMINLIDMENKPKDAGKRNQVLKIGIAGFCFGNIMMLSFPEYFSFGNYFEQEKLPLFFAYLNLLLSLPVFFYAASGFFLSAWKSLRHFYLNIDAPIALAILITFLRSIYEILSHTGAGYLDSMSGIVFFMLIGRYFQERTYKTLSFDRDYKSYFPLGVGIKDKNGKESRMTVSQLQKGDVIIIRNNELVPADSILLSKQAHIDNSFITGESGYIKKLEGELIHAGGKQMDGLIELVVVKPASQSYLTQLWNRNSQSKVQYEQKQNYLNMINRYFTISVLMIALLSALYWLSIERGIALNALTAVLIVACPCGLLLTSTFANGNILRIFGKHNFYLKNAAVIERLSKVDTLVFDKTGTITYGSSVCYIGDTLSDHEMEIVATLAGQSSHPLSNMIHMQYQKGVKMEVSGFEEIPGHGIKGCVDGKYLILGSEYFVTGGVSGKQHASTKVFLMLEGIIKGYFSFTNAYREGLNSLVEHLSEKYSLKLLSGDNNSELETIERIFGKKTDILFDQKPLEKMEYIKKLQSQGHKVMMIGDGLNDAGALMQSDIGIAVSDDTNNFSPACDAILGGASLSNLFSFIGLAKAGKKVVMVTFFLSIVYNIIGLSYAVQGLLSPVIAAILMPISSVTIVLLATISTNLLAKIKRL